MILRALLLSLLLATPAFAQQVPNPVNAPASITSTHLYSATGNRQQAADSGKSVADLTVTWPSSGNAVISNATNTPASVAPVNNNCLVGNATPAWVAGGCGPGRRIGTQVFCSGTGSNCTSTNCSSGCTYTPTVGTTQIIVTVIAPGGGGGGNVACTTTTGSGGGTGGAGEVIQALVTTGFSGATATVPAGGAGGANTGANGTAGGNATFIKAAGVSITADGGGAGNGNASAAVSGTATGATSGGSGGSVSGATLIVDIAGQLGADAAWTHSSSVNFGTLGPSGVPGLGFGTGTRAISQAGGGDILPIAGSGYGFGGGGGSICLAVTGAAHAGQAGGPALIIIQEFS